MQAFEVDLINQVKSDDNQAFEQLLQIYKNFITSVSRKYFLSNSDEDDLFQVATHAFYMAIKSFDADKKIEFKKYARVVIERALQNEIKKTTRQKDIPVDLFSFVGSQGQVQKVDGSNRSEFDKTYISIKTENQTPESIAINEDSLQKTLQKIKSTLSEFEMSVLEYYLQGLSYVEIAEMMQKDRKSIDNAILRIKQKLSFLREKTN